MFIVYLYNRRLNKSFILYLFIYSLFIPGFATRTIPKSILYNPSIHKKLTSLIFINVSRASYFRNTPMYIIMKSAIRK